MPLLILLGFGLLLTIQAQNQQSSHVLYPPPSQCKQNERYMTCGPPCGDSWCKSPSYQKCNTPNNHCGPHGCYCEPGYVRDEQSHSCVPSYQCHEQNSCPYNEVYNNCGNSCENTCSDLASGKPKFCPYICKPPGACTCKQGFYRYQHQCVPPSGCPKSHHCPQNEQWVNCAPSQKCQRHCDPRDQDDYCPDSHYGNCRGGCVCKSGFVRDGREHCVHINQCRQRPHWGPSE